ncbi:MAG: PIN domain-containing protein, partial [Solirubrobacteraceae bacterium]
MRTVVDPNVLVSAAISPAGPPRQIVAAWIDGRFELVISPALLDELRKRARPAEVPPLDQRRCRARARRRPRRRRGRPRRPACAARRLARPPPAG